MNKEILRKIISLFLSFVTALLVFFTGLGAAVCIVFSTPSVAYIMKNDKFILNVEEEILFELKSYAGPGGLPSDFFADGLNENTLRKNVDVAIKCAKDHTPFKSVDFKDETREQIFAFAKSQGMDVENEDIKNNVEKLLEYFETAYKAFMCGSALRAIGPVTALVFPYGIIAVFVLAALSMLLYNVVRKMNTDRKLYFYSAFLGGAFMLLLIPVFILLSGTVGGININSPSIFYLVSTIIYAFLITLIVEAVLIIAFLIIKRLSQKR